MEKGSENRTEPEVEVDHEPEKLSSTFKQPETARHASPKPWRLVTIILIGLVALGLGLWMVLPTGTLSMAKQKESPEIMALKEEVQKLRSEANPLKNDLQTLQAEQKVMQEQLAALKEKMMALTKKTESLGENKATPKAIVYKIKKGDTLSSIAKKYHVQPEDIRRWNQLSPKALPKPGKTITIYSPTDS